MLPVRPEPLARLVIACQSLSDSPLFVHAMEAGSLAAWLSQTPIQHLPLHEVSIRHHLRQGWHYGDPRSFDDWQRQALRQDIASLDTLPTDSLLLALASFHGSGRLREVSVRRLQQCDDGSELPFLLLRCNDWVKPVATLAQAALRQRLQPRSAAALLRCLPLLDSLRQARRNDLAILLRDIRLLLKQPSCAQAVRTAWHCNDRLIARGAFVLSAEACGEPPDPVDVDALRDVLLQALNSKDLWLRIWAARLSRARLYGPALATVAQAAHRDRSVPVRREALLALIDHHPELEASLLDPCVSLRSMVRFYLRKKATLHFAAYYRHAVQEAWLADRTQPTPQTLRRLCVAIDGLGETAASEPASEGTTSASSDAPQDADAPSLQAALYDPRPKLRRSALRALVRIDRSPDKAQAYALLTAALRDEAPSVVHAALDILATEGDGSSLFRFGADALWAVFELRREVGIRRHLLRVLELFSRWTRLGYLLRACKSDDDVLAREAQVACRRALSTQIFVSASDQEKARIESALRALPATPDLRSLDRHVRLALF